MDSFAYPLVWIKPEGFGAPNVLAPPHRDSLMKDLGQ